MAHAQSVATRACSLSEVVAFPAEAHVDHEASPRDDLKGRWGTWADVAQDVDHLWSAEDRHARPFEPPTLSRQLRSSLPHSSLMSRISAITPKLASELVRLNLWSAEQSLGFAAAYLRGDERNVKSYENNLLRDLGEVRSWHEVTRTQRSRRFT